MPTTADADVTNLIPALLEWNHGDGISIDAWIRCVGSVERAIGYGHLFWPALQEHDGCVFFAHAFSASNYRSWMETLDQDKRAVEAVMNHRHLSTVFGDPDQEPSEAQLIYLGQLLRDTWAAKLSRDYPDRCFIVTFNETAAAEPLDFQITFNQAVHPTTPTPR